MHTEPCTVRSESARDAMTDADYAECLAACLADTAS